MVKINIFLALKLYTIFSGMRANNEDIDWVFAVQ